MATERAIAIRFETAAARMADTLGLDLTEIRARDPREETVLRFEAIADAVEAFISSVDGMTITTDDGTEITVNLGPDDEVETDEVETDEVETDEE